MALVRLALRRGMPVFGICRGMQVLNVALGGTLYQDLPSQWECDVLKHRQDTPKWQPAHEVRVREGSYTAAVMGREIVKVNSYHHQAVRVLAEGMVATGHSSDGVIEAVEAGDLSERWLLGVQWHAEAMRGAGPQQERLFEAHVSAAERHAVREAAA
jgi:putative glutamine amidotransferase